MNGRKKPRQPHWPARTDVIQVAMLSASKHTAAEIAAALAPVDQCVAAMRQGQGTADDWGTLAATCAVALVIEDQGVVRGLRGHLQAVDAALQSIAKRCETSTGWRRTALWFHEIDALNELVFLHRHQMQHLSAAELQRAVDLATARTMQAQARSLAVA